MQPMGKTNLAQFDVLLKSRNAMFKYSKYVLDCDCHLEVGSAPLFDRQRWQFNLHTS